MSKSDETPGEKATAQSNDNALADLIDSGDLQLATDAAVAADMHPAPAADLSLLGNDLEPMILTLGDLFPDENGEVVISTEDGLAINLITAGEPSISGIADDHVTAAGIDVSGLHFCTFDGGLTVYFESEAQIQFSHDLT